MEFYVYFMNNFIVIVSNRCKLIEFEVLVRILLYSTYFLIIFLRGNYEFEFIFKVDLNTLG